MQAFTYQVPTEIVFGKGAEEQTGKLVRKYGGQRVLIVYGGGSVVKSGLLDKISAMLDAEGVAYRSFGGVVPNPVLSHAREGVALALDFKADFVLAVGGGSVIDTAKAIAHGLGNPDTDLWKFWKRELPLTQSMPVGVVLTISAAGSETSASAVITDEDANEKRGITTEFNRPRFAVMNPELTYTLPKFQIACGIVDILMHTLDKYFTQTDGNQMTDQIAAAIMRVVISNGPAAMHNPEDYDAMSELMWSGSLSHNGLTTLGRPVDFAVHQMAMELGGFFDSAHGATLSAVWGAWAEYCLPAGPERFAKYAADVWGVTGCDIETAAKTGIAKTVAFFKSIEMPTCFSELGIGVQPDETLQAMADSCVFHGKRLVGDFVKLNRDDVYRIYALANR